MMKAWKLPVVVMTLTVMLAGMLYEGGVNPAAAEGLFDDVNLGQKWLRLFGQFVPVHKWRLADC